jgi:nucleoid DNA-binding protein
MHKPRNLTFTTLTEVVSAEAGVSPKIVEKVLHAAFDVIGRNTAAGFRTAVTNFGTWYRSSVAPRVRVDLSGEEYRAPRTNYPRFRYSPRLREATTSGDIPETLRKRGQGQVK